MVTTDDNRESSFSLVVKQLSTRSSLAKAGDLVHTGAKADSDRAECDLRSKPLDLDIPQPPGQTATNEEEAVLLLARLAPVLVRPSFMSWVT